MKYIITIIILFIFQNTFAGTITYGSYPQQDSGFYFSDGQGNSVNVGSTRSVPYIYNNYPAAIWVDAATNRLPANMIIYQYINGYPSYLCRIFQNGNWYYGQLVDNGCSMQDSESEIYTSFQVLIARR